MPEDRDNRWLEFAAAQEPGEETKAPARLRARLLSRLNLEQAKEGPLASVGESKAAGRPLCVFEEIVRLAPVGGNLRRRNYCRVCHARLLAENLDKAPIWWEGCPYSDFQKT